MSKLRITLRYGRGFQEAELEPGHLVGILEPVETCPLADIPAAVKEAVRRPVDGSPPLARRVRPGQKVTILVSDVTRAWVQSPAFLPTLVAELNAAGVPDDRITLLLANGTHRPHRTGELPLVVGTELSRRLRVVEHDCRDEASLVHLGTTSRGTPVRLNRLAVETDALLLTGGIVFHLMSGFGGGRKSVCPGVAAYDTVQANHCLLLDPGAQDKIGSAKTAGNPMHEDLMEIARMVSPGFLLNVILNGDGAPAEFVAGDWDSAWEAGCRKITAAFGRPLASRGRLTVASCGGYPKDLNLYQATKALDNAALATEPGGVIVLVAACPDGGGAEGFFEWFDHPTLAGFEAALRAGFTVPGYVALYQAKVARDYRVHLVSDLPEATVRRTGAVPFRTLEAALAEAYRHLGPAPRTVLMPHAAATMPRFA